MSQIKNVNLSCDFKYEDGGFQVKAQKTESGGYTISIKKIGGNEFDPQALAILKLFCDKFTQLPSKSDFENFFHHLPQLTHTQNKVQNIAISTIVRASDSPEPPLSPPPMQRNPSLLHLDSKEAIEQFKGMIADLDSVKILPTDKDRALMTIKDFEVMRKNFNTLKTLGTDEERKSLINKLCAEHGGGGLEHALSSKNIAHRIDLLLHTYQMAKEKGVSELARFFMSFGAGGACASNRIENLAIFAAELHGHDIRNMAEVDPETTFVVPLILFQEDMFNLIDQSKMLAKETTRSERLGNRNTFKEHVLKNLDAFAKKFAEKEDTLQLKAFLEYLKHERIYDGKKPINWHNLLTQFVNSVSFVQVYNHIWSNALSTL